MPVSRVTALLALASLLMLPAAVPAGAGAAGFRASADPGFEAAFRRSEGFCGADGAGSIPLGPDRALWLFGDTFLGRIEAGRRVACTLVNNTVALARRDAAGAWSFRYLWRTKGGKPAPFFAPIREGRYFWPLHGALLDGRLHVFLMEIEAVDTGDPLGFRIAGNALATVENPGDDPLLWRPRIVRVPAARATPGETILWGSAVLARGGAVFVYGYRERKREEKDVPAEVRRELVCARASRRLDDFGRWRVGRRTLAADIAVECSVTDRPDGGVLLCHTASLFDPTVLLRHAPAPGRPFGPPVRAFTPPLPAGRRGFAYAAKLHPECEEEEKGALLTWVVNSFDFFELLADASLYWPRATRLKVEAPRR